MREDSLSSPARSQCLSALINVPQQSLDRHHLRILYFISVFWPCMPLRKLGCLKSKHQEKCGTQKSKNNWPLWLNPKAIFVSGPKSSLWCQTSPQGLVPLSEFEHENSTADAQLFPCWMLCVVYEVLLQVTIAFSFSGVVDHCWSTLGTRIQSFLSLHEPVCTYTHIFFPFLSSDTLQLHF